MKTVLRSSWSPVLSSLKENFQNAVLSAFVSLCLMVQAECMQFHRPNNTFLITSVMFSMSIRLIS